MSVQNKTMAIKARLANYIRKTMYPYMKKNIALTDEEKVAFFNDMAPLVVAMHTELRLYKQKRQYKRKIQEERIKRGVKPKRKTGKTEYEEWLKNRKTA